MQCLTSSRIGVRAGRPCKFATRSRTTRQHMPAIRAQQEPMSTASQPTVQPTLETSGASISAVEPVQSTLLGSVQEAINGRSAMLGFVAAVVSELSTHQSVWSQIAGKYVDTEVVEKPIGQSTLLYFAVIMLISLASIAPRLVEDLAPDSRSFGPFTPTLEKTLGRAAMLGFAGWVVLENVLNMHFL